MSARKFAAEGAHVRALADAINAEGGHATAHVVDATDERAVNAYVDRVAADAGQIDGVFNGIGGRPVDLGYPEPIATLDIDQFMQPIRIIVGSTYLTSRAAGLHMARQRDQQQSAYPNPTINRRK